VVTKIGRPDVRPRPWHLPGRRLRAAPPDRVVDHGRTKPDLIDRHGGGAGPLPGVSVNFTQPMAMRSTKSCPASRPTCGEDLRSRRGDAGAPRPRDRGTLRTCARSRRAGRGALRRRPRSKSSSTATRRPFRDQRVARAGARETRSGHRGHRGARRARRFGVVVRFPEQYAAISSHRGPDAHGPAGEKVPLSRVARVSETSAPSGQRTRTASGGWSCRATCAGATSAASWPRPSGPAARRHPPGYFVEWGGQFENQQRAMRRLALVIPLSLAIHLPAAVRDLRHAPAGGRWSSSTCPLRWSVASRPCGRAG